MAAGLSIFSYQQRHDLNGKPYPGVRYYFYAADTSDPIDIYRDPTLAARHQNPVAADAWGVLPAVFIPDTVLYYRVRVTTAAGVILSDDAVVGNLIPTSGGGDPPTPIPADAVSKTGDLKHRFGEGIHEGWLPCNNRTFGSSVSGADYVSDEYESLFLYLYPLVSGDKIVGGKGVSAAADWAANKQMHLPDLRGRVLAGLDDMDASAANVLPGLDALGETTGQRQTTLTAGQIPQLTTSSNGDHRHFAVAAITASDGTDVTDSNQIGRANNNSGNPQYYLNGTTTAATIGRTSEAGAHTHTVGASSPAAVPTVQPSMGVSIYIKL